MGVGQANTQIYCFCLVWGSLLCWLTMFHLGIIGIIKYRLQLPQVPKWHLWRHSRDRVRRCRQICPGKLRKTSAKMIGVAIFITWPILLILGEFKGLAAEVGDQAGGVIYGSKWVEQVVVYEARMLHGEKMYVLGTELQPTSGPGQRIMGVGEDAIRLDIEKVGLTDEELKDISTITVIYPLVLCGTIFVASFALIIAALTSNSCIGFISGILHGLASTSIIVYFVYIVIIIDKMMSSLKTWQQSLTPDRSNDAFERLSLTWPVWLQLFHILLYPGALYATFCGFNIFTRNYGKEKTIQATFDWESSKESAVAPFSPTLPENAAAFDQGSLPQ
ncbi:unnamed protein product [Allacma fusca]|uniref:Uncharacterized protein n=1 Tax=Allacma fusca TaxID=39272 RepID=A0A8J2KR21_9HEXA|nr:unnamed protein product [Allacma fusca]